MTDILAVEALNVTKRYGDLTAVDSTWLQVAQGEVYGVLGPNGAGKTTFLRMLFGLTSCNGTIGSSATLLPGEFELNVKSNDCHTPGGPSKIVGLLTITDTRGNDVPNSVFEFDSCFNPNSSHSPTGVVIPPSPPTPTTDIGSLTLATGALKPDGHGEIRPALICSAAGQGCGERQPRSSMARA